MTAELFAFTQTAPPCKGDLRTLAETIHRRLLGLMKRRGMLGKETISNGEQQLDALAACGQLCIGGEQVGDLDTGLGRNALTGLTGGQRR